MRPSTHASALWAQVRVLFLEARKRDYKKAKKSLIRPPPLSVCLLFAVFLEQEKRH